MKEKSQSFQLKVPYFNYFRHLYFSFIYFFHFSAPLEPHTIDYPPQKTHKSPENSIFSSVYSLQQKHCCSLEASAIIYYEKVYLF